MSSQVKHRIVLLGANGDLGHRIAQALLERRVEVVAIIRPRTSATKLSSLLQVGASPLEVDFENNETLTKALQGATCIVSALNGLEPVIVDLQERVLTAAIAARVPRFVPSDYSLDYTTTRPGDNRNMDLRRAFMHRIDAAPIRAASVLNGAFADLLSGEAPIVLHRWHRILHWGAANQLMDFTAKDDVAQYTAEVALDEAAPRYSRIAGDVVSPKDLASVMGTITSRPFSTLRAGGLPVLSGMIAVAKTLSPKTDAPFPAWQGMQYLRDMQSGRGKIAVRDNARYTSSRWTSAKDVLTAHARTPQD